MPQPHLGNTVLECVHVLSLTQKQQKRLIPFILSFVLFVCCVSGQDTVFYYMFYRHQYNKARTFEDNLYIFNNGKKGKSYAGHFSNQYVKGT